MKWKRKLFRHRLLSERMLDLGLKCPRGRSVQTKVAGLLLPVFFAALFCMGCGNPGAEAELKLSQAIWHQGAGEFNQSKQRLQSIISDYPETEAARKAQAMLGQMKEVILSRVHQLKEQGKIAKAEKLCGQIITQYPGTSEAAEAFSLLEQMKERHNKTANQDLRDAYVAARDYFTDYPGGRVNLEGLHYYGLEESPGVTIDIVDDREGELVMTGKHDLGNKVYTVFFNGRMAEASKE
jgi:outer membrane protein assembly factor BamD (BamD/ComL family)